MGSDQSAQAAPPRPSSRTPHLTRGHTIATPHVPDPLRSNDPTPSGNNSPGASVCSDCELPYISYTVNRPIGDSPKMTGKSGATTSSAHSSNNRPSEKRGSALGALQRRQLSLQPRRTQNRTHNIVVVKEARAEPGIETDEDVLRLQQIPMFLPIMKGTQGLTVVRDPEVLEGLDFRPWLRLASRYQAHLAACAQPVSAEQATLTQRCKETDTELTRLITIMTEKQRQNAKTAERLSRVHEISHQLTRCHSMLNQAIESMDVLNNMLPIEDRLEPFVWTTG